jgi:ABC-type transporter Mla MlaB component
LPALEPSTIVLVISGPIERAHITTLCDRVRALLESSGANLVVCDLTALVDPDAVAVDALARLQLTARGLERRVMLANASDELKSLLRLMGLTDVLPTCPELSLESKRQTE